MSCYHSRIYGSNSRVKRLQPSRRMIGIMGEAFLWLAMRIPLWSMLTTNWRKKRTNKKEKEKKRKRNKAGIAHQKGTN